MAQPKPRASLSSSLLARKGDARPAMRPQDLTAPTAGSGDDLGWNDMGSAVPSVLVEREALKVGIERPVAVSAATAARIGRETRDKTKAAFTLRLDTDRHLRLRLASAVTGSSSQHLVTLALDAFLQTLPEVDALVAQLPMAKPKR